MYVIKRGRLKTTSIQEEGIGGLLQEKLDGKKYKFKI